MQNASRHLLKCSNDDSASLKVLKVLLLFTSNNLGGAERSLTRMALKAQDIHYQFATLYGEGVWCEWVRSNGREPLVFGRSKNKLTLSALGRLIGHLRRNPVDIVYVCGARASFLLRFLRILLPKLKLVQGVRWNPDSNSHLDIFFRSIERFTYPLIDAWIANSSVTKQTLINRCKIPADRVFVIYNGLEPASETIQPFENRPLEVLTVANLSPRKGHVEYLKVIQKVIKAIPEARFIFIGRDYMNGKIQLEIEKSGLASFVHYEGFQKDVSPWLRRARLFVLPSLGGEGCPTAILEAMSFAVPCIAFAVDGIPELIEDGQQGKLLQRGDYSGMSLAIIEMLRDDNLYVRYGINGQKRVNSDFKLENTRDLHHKAFVEIASM